MEAGALTVEDLLNFNLGEDLIKQNTQKALFNDGLALPDFAEEELEWLSNKDAFPSLESCLDILNHHSPVSPVSVLDNLNSHKKNIIKKKHNFIIPLHYPMKPRTNHRRRRSCFPDPPTQHFAKPAKNPNPNANQNENQIEKQNQNNQNQRMSMSMSMSMNENERVCVVMGRKCMHCQVDKTPQWRAGPAGPKTLCNACGVRYKSGRLVPEYRPANSPTFSSVLHSNSHRKVVEMRREKVLEGAAVNEPCVYSRPGSCRGERRS